MRRERQRPKCRAQRQRSGGPHRHQLPGGREHRRETEQPRNERHHAKRCEADTQYAECRGIQIVEAAGPKPDEIAMRKFTTHHTLRPLREHSFVRRRPAHEEMRTHREICQSEHASERQNRRRPLTRGAMQPPSPSRSTCRTPLSSPPRSLPRSVLRSDGVRSCAPACRP
jgi:hypothetical protein